MKARSVSARLGFPLLMGLLLGTLPDARAADRPEEEGDGESPPAGAVVDEALAKKRQALDLWANEPLSLETSLFVLHVDRRDGSFFFQDRRTGVKWFSSWGRRGFASVLKDGWAPLDRIENPRAEERALRFRGVSSAVPSAALDFRIDVLEGDAGVSLRFEVPAGSGGKEDAIRAVRLLDGCLWVPDAEQGGAVVPLGMGRWLASSAEGDLSLRVTGAPSVSPAVPVLGAPAGGGALPALFLPFLGLVKSENPILVTWPGQDVDLSLERRSVPGDTFPGMRGIFVSADCRGPRGGLEIRTLGKEWSPVIDAARAYVQTLGAGSPMARSLRYKTGARPEFQGFAGAAIFRPRVGAERTFRSVAEHAEHLHRDLGIDAAAIVLSGWTDGPPLGEDGGTLAPRQDAGGTEGVREWARRLREIGFQAGLEVDVGGMGPGGPSGVWSRAWERFSSGGAAEALEDLGPPSWILFRGPILFRGAPGAAQDAEARSAAGRKAREMFGLVGFGPAVEADLEHAVHFEGFLDGTLTDPTADAFWPIFTAAFGHCVRLGATPDRALRPDDPAGILAHLLVGEVPVYELPPASGAAVVSEDVRAKDPRWCLARDEGWAAGRGLSAHDVFLKNTYEVLSHLARHRAREPLLYHRKLVPDGKVRESFFGPDLRIVVNFGPGDYEDPEDGFKIPPNGFVVRHPFLLAFHALRVNDVEYERPAFFVVRSLEGKMYLRAERVLIYHGFGPDRIDLGGRTFRVEKEEVVRIW